MKRLVPTLIAAALLGACTTQAWYEGTRESARQQCRQRYPDAASQQSCIDQVNSKSYQQYRQERDDGDLKEHK